MSQIVYLDICCFKRPFDDASVERVRREAEAVAVILDAAQAGTLQLVRSPAHDFENERNPPEDRRLATRLWAGAMRFMMQYDPGQGDYSKERHDIFAALTLDDLLQVIKDTNSDPATEPS